MQDVSKGGGGQGWNDLTRLNQDLERGEPAISGHGSPPRPEAFGEPSPPVGFDPSRAARCHDCGLSYDDPAWIEAVVSDHIWNQHLSPTGDEGGLLCIGCMAKRAVAAGLTPLPVKLTAGPFLADTSLKPPGRRGRYRGNGGGWFIVGCFCCPENASFFWGVSGPARAPQILREEGWQMTGRTVNARWLCPKCARDSNGGRQ